MSKGPGNRGSKRASKVKARKRRRASNVMPLGARQIDSLLAGFTAWLSTDTFDGVHAESVVTVVGIALRNLGSDPRFDPTAWTPDDAHDFLDLVESLLDEVDDQDLDAVDEALSAGDKMVSAMVAFFGFLDDTGRWRGTDDDYAHCMGDFDDHLQEFTDDEGLELLDVERPDIPADRELAALLRLPIIAHLRGLSTWVGDGQPITERGVPEASAIGAIAQACGIAPSPADLATQDLTAVAEFMALWRVAVSAELIEVSPEGVRRGRHAGRLDHPTVDDLMNVRIAVSVSVAELCVEPFFISDEITDMLEHEIQQTVLAGMTEDAMTIVDPDALPLDGLRDADEAETTRGVLARMQALCDGCIAAGWLIDDDGFYRVPMDLRPAVHDAFRLLAEQRPPDPTRPSIATE